MRSAQTASVFVVLEVPQSAFLILKLHAKCAINKSIPRSTEKRIAQGAQTASVFVALEAPRKEFRVRA